MNNLHSNRLHLCIFSSRCSNLCCNLFYQKWYAYYLHQIIVCFCRPQLLPRRQTSLLCRWARGESNELHGGVEADEGRGQGTLMRTLKIDSKICRGAAQQRQRFVYNRNVYNYNVHNPTRYHIHFILGLPQWCNLNGCTFFLEGKTRLSGPWPEGHDFGKDPEQVSRHDVWRHVTDGGTPAPWTRRSSPPLV